MAYWILKTEPTSYSYDDLQREGRTVWDGVASAQALNNLRQMQPGDVALIYHSADERAVVGVARVVSEAYPDPALDEPKRVVVDVEAVRRLARPVSLKAIKADPLFAQHALVCQSRLSVAPVDDEQWQKLVQLGG